MMIQNLFNLRTALMLAALTAWAVPGAAATIPWRDVPYSHISNNEPVGDLLRDFCAVQGINVVISEKVEGVESGRFDEMPPRKFFNLIITAYGLTWYYDGNVLYIYKAHEVASAMIRLEHISARKLIRVLKRLDIADSRFPLRYIKEDGLVYVSGPKIYIDLVRDAAAMLDDSAMQQAGTVKDQEMIRVFPLKFAWADDHTFHLMDRDVSIPGIGTILRNLVSGGDIPRNIGGRKEKRLRRTVSKLKGTGLQAAGNSEESQENSGDKGISGSGISAPANGGDTQPGPSIQEDTRLNAIIIKDARKRMPYYEELISVLDVPAGLVEIQAAILDIGTSYARELGTEWRFHSVSENAVSGNALRTQGGFDADEDLDYASDTLALGSGLNYATILGSARNFFMMRIHALEQSGNAHVLSRPSVLTLDNTEAVLEHIRTFYIKVAGDQEVDLFNVDAGIVLKVTPHIIEERDARKIKMIINIEDGDIQDQTIDDLPVIQKSTVNTQATIGENQSLLIGGYSRKDATGGEQRVPCLGGIPLLGMLFKSQNRDHNKYERYFLITPRIVKPDDPETDYKELLEKEPDSAPESQMHMLK